jgi:hypothetical protein
MIEGLKVTVNANELRELCMAQASFHRDRATTYAENLKNLEDAEIEGMQYSGGDPKKALRDKQTQHENSANELRFIADHLKAGEEYLLDQAALVKLGIARAGNGFW